MDGRRWMVFLIALALVSVMICGTSSAETRSGSEDLDEDWYYSIRIDFDEGELMEVSYTVTVTDGPNIDVFFVDSLNKAKLDNDESFNYNVAMSDLNTRYTTKSTTLFVYDTYYVVVDNSDWETMPPMNLENDIVYFDWEVETTVDTPVEDALDLACYGMIAVAIVIVLVIVVVVYLVVRKKKTPPQEGQYPPPYPGPGGQQQPPYQPPQQEPPQQQPYHQPPQQQTPQQQPMPQQPPEEPQPPS